MPIPLREDVAYIILKKINETGQELHPVKFTADDFIGREPTKAELLGHLDYLNQKQYIKAEFSGNAYGNQEDVPGSYCDERYAFPRESHAEKRTGRSF